MINSPSCVCRVPRPHTHTHTHTHTRAHTHTHTQRERERERGTCAVHAPSLPLCTHSRPLRTSVCGKVPACVLRTAAHAHSRNSQTLRMIRVQLSTSAAFPPPCNGKKPSKAERAVSRIELRVCELREMLSIVNGAFPSKRRRAPERLTHREATHEARSSQKGLHMTSLSVCALVGSGKG